MAVLPLVRGCREFVYDKDGNQYIDAISGVYNVSYGHAYPRIVKVLREFPEDGLINVYANPTPEREAVEAELRTLTGFTEAHLLSTGAEAVEKALLLALRSVSPGATSHSSPRRKGVLHFVNGFHGKTMGTTLLFAASYPRLLESPYPRQAGAPPRDCDEEELVLRAMRHRLEGGYGVVILEPVMSYFGYEFSVDFLMALRELCTECGAILIFDEMITGFGRAGVPFISSIVRPDILVTGKGLGQGLPISAVLFDTDGKVDASGFSWTTATANNALLCRVGLESCKILIEEEMVEASVSVGSMLTGLLAPVKLRGYEILTVGSMVFVRVGKGLHVDMSSVEDRLATCRHILTRVHGSTLVLMPPFVTALSSLEQIARAVDNELKLCTLAESYGGGGPEE